MVWFSLLVWQTLQIQNKTLDQYNKDDDDDDGGDDDDDDDDNNGNDGNYYDQYDKLSLTTVMMIMTMTKI